MAAPSSPIFATPLTLDANPLFRRNAPIFQPPTSPASSTTSPSFASATDYFSFGSRKRQRPDSSHGIDNRPQWIATPSRVQCLTPSDESYASAHESGFGQTSILVNERYKLKGGFDTPSLLATAEMEELQLTNDDNARRRLRDIDTEQRIHSESTPVFGALVQERNGVGRMPSSPNGEMQLGWTGRAVTLFGKMFNLGSSVMRGFYAGGGKGYDIKYSPAQHLWQNQEGCSTPLPGSWQEDEFLGDFKQDNPNSPPKTASRPPNKRRQTDRDTWVMVGTPEVTDASPKRKSSTTSIPRSTLATRPAASRASSRRSMAPLPRRQSSYVSHSSSPAVNAPMLELSKRASFAPTRSPNPRPGSSSRAAYVSPEAECYMKRRSKQERQADAAIGNMSRQLNDLIQQGKQALGTKYSIEGSQETDEGFVDDGW